MLRVASYGEYSPILELGQGFLVRLCTLGSFAFACQTGRIGRKTRNKTRCRIGVNYWRRALQSCAAVRPPALIHKKLRLRPTSRAAGIRHREK